MSTAAAVSLVIVIFALAVGVFACLMGLVTLASGFEARIKQLEKKLDEAEITIGLRGDRLNAAEAQIQTLSLAAMANKDFIVDPNGFVRTKH